MTYRCLFALVCLLNFNPGLNAQQQVNGRIYSAANDSVINAATVYNKKMRLQTSSAIDGSYSILAAEGDTLFFSAIGFNPKTVTVSFDMFLTRYDIAMQRKVLTLEEVKVRSSYQDDSINRRDYYRNIYKKQPGITGYNSPANGVGITLSPISYFSKYGKQKRILKKRLFKEEHDDYIDRSFPVEWVERVSSLEGDSLSLFMYRYRPTYTFCRKTDRDKMLIYINDKLKEFRIPKRRS